MGWGQIARTHWEGRLQSNDDDNMMLSVARRERVVPSVSKRFWPSSQTGHGLARATRAIHGTGKTAPVRPHQGPWEHNQPRLIASEDTGPGDEARVAGKALCSGAGAAFPVQVRCSGAGELLGETLLLGSCS